MNIYRFNYVRVHILIIFLVCALIEQSSAIKYVLYQSGVSVLSNETVPASLVDCAGANYSPSAPNTCIPGTETLLLDSAMTNFLHGILGGTIELTGPSGNETHLGHITVHGARAQRLGCLVDPTTVTATTTGLICAQRIAVVPGHTSLAAFNVTMQSCYQALDSPRSILCSCQLRTVSPTLSPTGTASPTSTMAPTKSPILTIFQSSDVSFSGSIVLPIDLSFVAMGDGWATNPKVLVANLGGTSITSTITLTGAGAVEPSTFGRYIARSPNGNFMGIGAPYDDSFAGAVFLFSKNGNGWTQRAKLVPSDVKRAFSALDPSSSVGSGVALSNNGDTVAILGLYNIWVYVRTGLSLWSQQGPTLNTTSNNEESISISHDGNTIAVGIRDPTLSKGNVTVYYRSGSTWTLQASLIASDVSGVSQFGKSTALSYDGNVLAVGASRYNQNQGGSWIFQRNGTVWTQLGPKLYGSGASGTYQGYVVKLSNSGRVMAASGADGIWVFVYDGVSFAQYGEKVAVNCNTFLTSFDMQMQGNVLSLIWGCARSEPTLNGFWLYQAQLPTN